MDTSIMIIGFVLLLLVVLPIYFIVNAKNIDKKQVKSLFAKHSQENKYNFQLIANQGRKVLGMDPQNKGLLFIDFNLKEPLVAFQDLKQSESCAVATSSPLGKSNVLGKIEWIFISKKGTPADSSVLFHDSDRNYLIPVYAHEELKLAQQWQETIQKHL
jgi:hypothetical protein